MTDDYWNNCRTYKIVLVKLFKINFLYYYITLLYPVLHYDRINYITFHENTI